MRTIEDFVNDCVSRGRTGKEILQIALMSQWHTQMNQVKEIVANISQPQTPFEVMTSGIQFLTVEETQTDITVNFSNGYGALVTKENGKWSLALLKDSDFCFETSIASDVISNINPSQINSFFSQISKLCA